MAGECIPSCQPARPVDIRDLHAETSAADFCLVILTCRLPALRRPVNDKERVLSPCGKEAVTTGKARAARNEAGANPGRGARAGRGSREVRGPRTGRGLRRNRGPRTGQGLPRHHLALALALALALRSYRNMYFAIVCSCILLVPS